MAIFKKYVNRVTNEKVTAMKYTNIEDFPDLYELIGDIYPAINKAHTRIWEGNWIVRKSDNSVEFICCGHPEDSTCFDRKYEIFK